VENRLFLFKLIKYMPKSKDQKKKQLEDITSRLTDSQGLVFTADAGLTVKETELLRSKLRAEKAGLQFIKKTLLEKALLESKITDTGMNSTGNVALTYSATDAVAPARLVYEVSKSNDKFKILGGLLDGKFIGSEQVIALAKLPSRQELLAQVVRTINAPVSGFVNVLAGNLRGLVTVLTAIKDKK